MFALISLLMWRRHGEDTGLRRNSNVVSGNLKTRRKEDASRDIALSCKSVCDTLVRFAYIYIYIYQSITPSAE